MRRFAIPFLDVMTLLVLVLLLLIFAALMKVSDAESKAKVESTSRYIITMDWDEGSRDDIDLSVRVPSGEIVYFRTRQAVFAALDRDDLGLDSNTVIDDAGNAVTLKARSETIYLRQTIAGTYVFNVHAYNKMDAAPAHVRVTLTSVGDRTSVVTSRQITLAENHDERTAFRATIDAGGSVVSVDQIEELFVNDALGH